MKLTVKLILAILIISFFSQTTFSQKTKKTAESYYSLGLQFTKNHKYDDAIEFFSLSISVKPDFSQAYVGRSKAKQYKGDFEDAFKDIQRAIKIDPNQGEAYFRRANLRNYLYLQKLKNIEEISVIDFEENNKLILEDLDLSVKNNFKTAEVFSARAEHKCVLMKLCRESLQDYDSVLAINPIDSATLQKRAIAKYKNGDFQEAIDDYLKIPNKIDLTIQNNKNAFPNDNAEIASEILEEISRFFNKKVFELESQGKNEEFFALISDAIDKFPGSSSLYITRAQSILHRMKNDVIERDAFKIVQFSPFNFEIQKRAIFFLTGINRCEPALNISNESVLENPQKGEAYITRANVKTCLKDFESALEDNDKAVFLEPENEKFKANRAYILRSQNNIEESILTFTETINSLEAKLSQLKITNYKDPIRRELAYAYIARSRVYAQKNDIEKTFADLDRAVELLPEFYAFETRAQAYQERKMYDKAVEDFTSAIKAMPQNTALNYKRGEIYFAMGKYELALEDYKKAAEFKGEPFNTIVNQKIEETKAKIAEKK